LIARDTDQNGSRLGLDALLFRSSEKLDHQLAEPTAPMLAALVKKGSYTHFTGAHTALNKNVFPRVAALLDVQQVHLPFIPLELKN
jgi:electron transfer flavoprotein alpha subunit